MRASIDCLTDFRPSSPRMAKESSLQISLIDLFVKEAYRLVNIVRIYKSAA